MHTVFGVFDTAEQREEYKAKTIARMQSQPGFKYGDDFIESYGERHTLRVFPVTFPLADAGGYDSVHCVDVIEKLQMILGHLKALPSGEPEIFVALEPDAVVGHDPAQEEEESEDLDKEATNPNEEE